MPKKRIIKTIKSTTLEVKDIIEIILNVDDYKNFIPHCKHSKVLSGGTNYKIAEILISFSIFKILYTSYITFTENSIEVKEYELSKTKIFNHLLNTWKIEKVKDEIKIDFFVDFEIKNKILNKIAEKTLGMVSEIIIEAFLKRLNEIK